MTTVEASIVKQDPSARRAGACPACGQPPGAGRFGWGGGAPEAHAERCPVCERVLDHFPAGCVELSGKRFAERRQEILKHVVRCAEAESARHALERIERTETVAGSVAVWTSHARLARRIGDFVREQFGGQLSYHFEHAPDLLRVSWRSET